MMFQIRPSTFGAMLLLAATWLTCFTAEAQTPDKESKFDTSYREMLDVWLGARIETLGIPGLAVAIVHDQDVV